MRNGVCVSGALATEAISSYLLKLVEIKSCLGELEISGSQTSCSGFLQVYMPCCRAGMLSNVLNRLHAICARQDDTVATSKDLWHCVVLLTDSLS